MSFIFLSYVLTYFDCFYCKALWAAVQFHDHRISIIFRTSTFKVKVRCRPPSGVSAAAESEQAGVT